MEQQRIKAIADAATLLFLRQGYAKTQISHIAKAVGVSVGTIYLDFAGKREIMHFVLKATIDPGFPMRDFQRPISDELFAGLDKEIGAAFAESGAAFAAHLADGAKDYSFEALISDSFDMLAKYAAGCLFIEKNQLDFPVLTDRYREYRKQFFDTMLCYMKLLTARGAVRTLEQIELSTSLMIETLTWWAMDQRYVAFDARPVPLDLAKAVCMDNIITAYRA